MGDRVVHPSGITVPDFILTPQPIPTTKRDPAFPLDRILEKIDRPVGASPDSCWEYTGSRFTKGYGAFWLNGRARQAHRVLWEYKYGPISEGLVLLHKCDNPPCCRVDILGPVEGDHFYLGTVVENNTDRQRKGRTAAGNGKSSPITEEIVLALRARHELGETASSLAREYGVSDATVSRIVNRQTYKHIS